MFELLVYVLPVGVGNTQVFVTVGEREKIQPVVCSRYATSEQVVRFNQQTAHEVEKLREGLSFT